MDTAMRKAWKAVNGAKVAHVDVVDVEGSAGLQTAVQRWRVEPLRGELTIQR